MVKFTKKIMLIVILLVSSIIISSKVNAAETLYYGGKMIAGKDICYWIDPSCQYTVTIPQAVSKLRYPSGLWNPMVLNKTTTKSQSKMDFYQVYESNTNMVAQTIRYPAKVNGEEQWPLSLDQADYTDWLYTKIQINDTKIYPASLNGKCKYDSDLLSTLILHEICHAYGGRHVNNLDCIMHVDDTLTVRGLCSDFNAILVQKYNY